MPTATLVESILFFDDVESPSNPQRKFVDWRRTASGLVFDQVYSERFLIAPGITKTLESGVGSTDLSATPVNLAPVTSQSTWYQFKGSFSSSPWAAALAVAGQLLTITVQVDGTVLVTGAGLASLSTVNPGDWVYMAGSGYGDTGSVAAINQGFWSVVAVGTGLTLRRIYPGDSAVTESVVVGAVNNLQLLVDANRPRWLFVRGSAVYSGLYEVVGAAIGWVAVVAPSQFVPATTVTFERLTTAPRYIAYVRVEADVPVTVIVGDVATAVNNVSLLPVATGVSSWYETFSFTTSLAVKNAGSNIPATVNVIYAFATQD